MVASRHTISRQVDVNGRKVKARFYTPGGLAEYLGKSIATIRVWMDEGVIPDTSIRDKDGTRLFPMELGQQLRRQLELDGRLDRFGRSQGSPRRAHDRWVRYGRREPVQERLYTVIALAEALEVSRRTVLNMEARGGLPESPFKNSSGRRLYTSAMIDIVEREYKRRFRHIRGRQAWRAFHEDVALGWEQLNVMNAKIVEDPE